MTTAKLTFRLRQVVAAGLATLLLFGAALAFAAEEPRSNYTTQGLKTAVDAGNGKASFNEFGADAVSGKRSESKGATDQSKIRRAAASSPNTDFWFYTADVELFADQDRDGYYYGIDLLFDADTIYAFADVYAVVYLSRDGGPWEEYAVTEDFTLLGASGEDEYVIVTELVSGYPTGSYDILIELFDALDDTFVADIGPADTTELSLLPLEDIEYDTPRNSDTTVVVNHGGGGAFDWPTFLVFLVIAAWALREMRKRVR
ncbi:MAG: choice-of-anchor H family protein [Woeseiaceae bacterium]|nr:choice-of-anchor H family protein [Woeseiaceae bacterium]